MKNLLLQIRLFHQYYDDGLMHNVSLLPDQNTQRFIDRYNLVIQQSQGSFSIYYFGVVEFADLCLSLADLLARQPLVFQLKGHKSQFTVISTLPLDRMVWLGFSSQNSEPLDHQSVQLNLLVSAHNTNRCGVLAEVSIYPQDLFSTTGERKTLCFDINIKARQTCWDYYVFNRSRVRLFHPLVTNHQGIEFYPPVEVTADNGEPALLFSSGEQHFALSETLTQPFKLVNYLEPVPQADSKNAAVGKTLLDGLPLPKTDQIGLKTIDGQVCACSEMYVYL